MRTFFSYLLAAAITFLALTIIPIERLFDELMNTRKVVESVKTANLYEHLTRLTAQKMLEKEQFGAFKDTPLMPTQDEVQAVLHKSFPEEWFLNNLSATHADLISFMGDPATQKETFVGMVLTDRKNLFSENLTALIKNKIDALPQCTPLELIKMRTTLPKIGKGTNIDILKLNLACKPPEQIQNVLLKTVRNQLDKAISILPDSLYWLHDKGRTEEKVRAFDQLKSAYRFSQSFAFIGYGLLILLLALTASINYENLQILLYRLGFPFVLSAVLLSFPFVLVIVRIDDIFTMSSMRFTSGEAFTDPINKETTQLIVSFIKTLTEDYSWNMLYFAATLFVIGFGLIIASLIIKIKPLSPLDSRHETDI